MERNNLKFNKIELILIGFAALITWLKVATVYYWWNLPDITLPGSPAIYKGVQNPEFAIQFVIMVIPCLLVLVVPVFRDAPKLFFVSGIFLCVALSSAVISFFYSFNVGGGGIIFLVLAQYYYGRAKDLLKLSS